MTGTDQKKRDLTITGTGTSSGGSYHRVRIRGEGDIEGDVVCNQLKVMGTTEIRGAVRAHRVRVMGTVNMNGNFHTEDLSIMGEVSIHGNCNAEKFKVRGTFDIDGMLNAGDVSVSLFGPSKVKEIGGEKITVKPNLPFSAAYKHLTVETVEGDEIHLEYTTAKVVRGGKVYVGPGCDIERVEYKSSYRASNKAKVADAKQV